MSTLFPQFLLLLAACPRVFALVAVAPGFSASFVPATVRVTLAAATAFAFSPLLLKGQSALLDLSPQAYIALLLSELLLGAILGFLLSCLLESARLGGEIVDLQTGFRAGALYDPLTADQSSLLGRLWYFAALVFFFTLDGHHWLLSGLMRSFELCPVGAVVLQRSLSALGVQAVTALFTLALQLCAPVVAALLLTDVALGLAGRSMPQMNLMLVGMPGKLLIGLLALGWCTATLGSVSTSIMNEFHALMLAVLRLVGV